MKQCRGRISYFGHHSTDWSEYPIIHIHSFRYIQIQRKSSNLRNRLPVGGGCVYFLQMFFVFCFFCFFLFFFRPSKIWDNRSRERLNGLSWNFHQTIGGNVVWNVVPPLGESRAAAWRMANVDDLRHLRYGSFAITRGRHVIYAMTLAESPEGATGGCVIQQWAGELM